MSTEPAIEFDSARPLIWLRSEFKSHEQRTPLTPDDAAQLLQAGFAVVVEESPCRVFATDVYRQAGCQIVHEGAWRNESPSDAVILGLKELPESSHPLSQRHIYFAHCYKRQTGWKRLLQRFVDGGGSLFDLEYLVDEQSRRVAAFGYWAGFAGCAVALLAWASQQNQNRPVLGALTSCDHQDELVAKVTCALDSHQQRPRIVVVGALGRSGRGAVEFATQLGIAVESWDLAETQRGGPFESLLEFDLLINCVFVETEVPPFLTHQLLQNPGRTLRVICDVSCDPHGDYNPLPIYDQCTTFESPARRLLDGDIPLDLVAIDHLPSLLPRESSEDFSRQLLPWLLKLNRIDHGAWHAARQVFLQRSSQL